MADRPVVERAGDGFKIQAGDQTLELDEAGLRWLCTAAGPAVLPRTPSPAEVVARRTAPKPEEPAQGSLILS